MLDDVVARQFLLGQLPPEEQGRIEELAFEDPDTFTFLESIEDDLIDEYIHGDLSAEEEQHFKDHFLSLPDRRNNLRVSQLLQQHFDKTADVSPKKSFSFLGWFKLQSPVLQISMTLAALGLVIFAVWVFIPARQARQSMPIQAESDRPVASPSPSFKTSPSVEPTASPVHVENKPKRVTPEKQKRSAAYAFLLAPSASTRGGAGVRQLTLAHDTSKVPIELALISQRKFGMYEAVLEDEAGKMLQRWSNLKAKRLTSGKGLQIKVPVTLLKPQELYRIVVSGVSLKGETEEIARYQFEVRD